MDLITVFEKFPSQEACIAHLENARWGDTPVCPHCGSEHVARKKRTSGLVVGIAMIARAVSMFCLRLFFRRPKFLCKSGF